MELCRGNRPVGVHGRLGHNRLRLRGLGPSLRRLRLLREVDRALDVWRCRHLDSELLESAHQLLLLGLG